MNPAMFVFKRNSNSVKRIVSSTFGNEKGTCFMIMIQVLLNMPVGGHFLLKFGKMGGKILYAK